MTLSTRHTFITGSVLGLILFASPALAATPTVAIQNLNPSSAVDASTTISFSVATTGFTNPAYTVSDAAPSSGGTSGTIDQIGFFTWTPTVFDAGHHTITVTVSDSLGDSATASVPIFVRNNSILVQGITPGAIVTPGRQVTFTVLAPGFTNPVFGVYDSIGYSSISSSNLSSSGAFTWTPSTNDVGPHSLYITAYDSQGHNASVTQLLTVVSPSVTVTSSSKPLTYLPAGTPMSFTVASVLSRASFSISDSFTGTTTMTAGAMNASTGVFNWTPTAADIGLHTVTISASDPTGNIASTTARLIVVGASLAPAVTTAPSTTTTPPPATGTGDGYVFTTQLAVGSRGAAVSELQKRLVALGLLASSPTGYYGALTAAAVRKFQLAHGLAQVGFVGPGTRKALNGQ